MQRLRHGSSAMCKATGTLLAVSNVRLKSILNNEEMYKIIPKNKYRYVDLLVIADVSTYLQMLSPILLCHLALSFRLVSSQGPKMDPTWWHYTKIAMYHAPILERGGNVSHNPRFSTIVLMLGMLSCALSSANQPLTRGEQWSYWFLPLKFILWS